jgi:hypothetical protein
VTPRLLNLVGGRGDPTVGSKIVTAGGRLSSPGSGGAVIYLDGIAGDAGFVAFAGSSPVPSAEVAMASLGVIGER